MMTILFNKISISYLEIYENSGYDLLDENHSTKSLHDLPKVHSMETADE
jgi:kinesin family protein 6/9